MTPRTFIIAAGTALIVITNGFILAGVAQNRSGEPEARITLSQRELARPRNWYGDRENSGLSLTLRWRVTAPATEPVYSPYYESRGGSPAWLDEKRMAELGFDVDRAKDNDARHNAYLSPSERQVLVVLELAGAAWQEAQASARQRLAHQESLRQASPEAKNLVEAEKRARDELAQEENGNSRLFAVDVGTDLTALRAKYPDRSRYLILKGKLRLHKLVRDNQSSLTGYLDQLAIHRINVPYALRGAFEAKPAEANNPVGGPPAFTATVAVGQRLEPWLEAVSAP